MLHTFVLLMCNASILRVRDVTVTYIRKSETPHIYTLSISTGKNQSTKVRVTLYIPTYEYNYKVVTRCDTILHEYHITDRRKYENIKRYIQLRAGQKELTSYKMKTRETSRGLGRMGAQTVNC